jgi:hypothetical protein
MAPRALDDLAVGKTTTPRAMARQNSQVRRKPFRILQVLAIISIGIACVIYPLIADRRVIAQATKAALATCHQGRARLELVVRANNAPNGCAENCKSTPPGGYWSLFLGPDDGGHRAAAIYPLVGRHAAELSVSSIDALTGNRLVPLPLLGCQAHDPPAVPSRWKRNAPALTWPLKNHGSALAERLLFSAEKTVEAPLFAGCGHTGSEAPVAKAPASLPPKAEAIEIEVNNRRRVKGQELANDQPADDRNAEWAAQFGALAEPNRQRHRPEHRRHRCHDDRPEAFEAGLIDRLA